MIDKGSSKGFCQGIVYSAALLVSVFEQPGAAQELLKDSGITRTLAEVYGAAREDIAVVSAAFAWPSIIMH